MSCRYDKINKRSQKMLDHRYSVHINDLQKSRYIKVVQNIDSAYQRLKNLGHD